MLQLQTWLYYAATMLPILAITIASAILYARHRSVATSMFFGGSIFVALVEMVRMFSISLNTENLIEWMQVFAVVIFIASLIQGVGLMIFALELPKNKQTESQR
jgi:hypothetical protein